MGVGLVNATGEEKGREELEENTRTDRTELIKTEGDGGASTCF